MTRLRAHVPGTPAGGVERRLRAAGQPGFTMGEVIFAVIILGIGLILLAAAFPVGIKQTEANVDRMNAGLVARHAYEQITQVRASGVFPDTTWTAQPISTLAAYYITPPVANYGDQIAGTPVPGKPLTMGLLDGAATATPDLRTRLIYPISIYAEDPRVPAVNPTRADDAPQHQTTPGQAAYDTAGNPVGFLVPWGFRFEGAWCYENVQWVWPSDRRYYWYAFYRQMNDATYPNPVSAAANWVPGGPNPTLQARVQADTVTRRTYEVQIVVCKLPGGVPPFRTPADIQRDYNNTVATALPDVYMAQWGTPATASNKYVGSSTIAPIRLPASDSGPVNFQVNPANALVIEDTIANGPIATLIQNDLIRRGGIILDCWGNVYQIVDFGGNQVRIDRPLPVVGGTFGPGTIGEVLPLWFNPNAIAVFPTIVVKQADLP